MFVTLEDESGYVNLIAWEKVWSRARRVASNSRLLEVQGMLQKEGGVIHVVVRRFVDRTHLLGNVVTQSRDFR
jgi:error-prone DNA polymerase